MNILEYTQKYMHHNYPISLHYDFVFDQEPNKEKNAYVTCSEALDDIVLTVHNNETKELQARFFVHEYHHLTQLEKHGLSHQIENRWKYEVETERFTRLEFKKILAQFKWGGINELRHL